MDATPLPLRPGDLLAQRYEILRLLGSGGSAYVYAAHDHRIGIDIALKLLRGGNRSEIDVERTRREAEFSLASASPHLVRTFDLVETEGHVFLTMELVGGGSLRDRLRRGPLSVEEVIRLAGEILEGLVALHAHDIVHRDLKPGNLLLTEDGHVKLSDFGIARRWTDDTRITVTGLPVGTVDYLSPEQAAGADVDPRADLYSLGIVLFEMLTGRVPFEASSAVGAIVMRLNRAAADVRALRGDTPRWLARFVARLLERNREERHPSAATALDHLHRKRGRMRWRPLTVAIVLALFLALSAFGFWWRRPSGGIDMVMNGDWGIRAVDANGDTLWTRPDSRTPAVTMVRRGAIPEIAAVLAPSPSLSTAPRFARTLSFLDVRTGRVLRTRNLPWPAHTFPEHSEFFGIAQVVAHDLNHDGYDEVIVSYVHNYFPSYTVLYDLRRDEARLLFIASGHHRVEGAADLDGDRVDELVLSGTANKQGWYVGIAAIRIPFPAEDLPYSTTAFTPDRFEVPRMRALLWYALCPPGGLRHRGVIVDSGRRIIRVEYMHRPPVELTFDGFPSGPWTPGTGTSAQRQAARDRAYEHLRDAQRFTTSGQGDAAVERAEAARSLAEDAGDPTLAEWSARVKGVALVHARRFDDASRLFTHLAEGSEAAADIAWDAGNALHLAGNLPAAVQWYRRSVGREGLPGVGRLKYEALQGLVLALGEMDRWDDAAKEIDRWAASFPNESTVAASWFRHFLAWRTGRVAFARYDPDEPIDWYRYWALEIRLALNAEPLETLRAIDADRARASETRRVLLLARAEALRRSGRLDEALQVAREAYLALRARRLESALDRGHFDLAAERLAKIAELTGLHAEAARVRAEAAALRWHPTGIPR
ncbi:MAG TPA: protein kinase [Thermoanaerobaculia bacterium]|nr:protein kinase [Thermoanaerobaculia bacterium]